MIIKIKMENLKKIINGINISNLRSEELPYNLLSVLHDKLSAKEIFHSEIIADMLNPIGKHGLRDLLLYEFMKLIEARFNTEEVAGIEVIPERGINGRSIDILITWNTKEQKNAIIIENKLNNSVDQLNQLNDYYDGIVNERYNVEKIVYMPLDINKKAVNTDINKTVLSKTKDIYPKDLIKWLNNCINKVSDNEAIHNLIMYRDLLKHMNFKYQTQMKAKEIQKELNNEDLLKLIKIAAIVNSDDWHNAKYEIIIQKLDRKLFDKNLEVVKKGKGKFAEFFFKPYKYWIELWAYPESFHLYICSYKDNNQVPKSISVANNEFMYDDTSSNDRHFFYDKDYSYEYPHMMDELVAKIESILMELKDYKE